MKQFLDLMRERNMLAQITHEEELQQHLKEKPRTAYAGFDPTADSLHIGHMLPVMALRRWQQAGHKAIVLVGGATAMIGDPTGKTDMRPMMTVDEIDARVERLKNQLSRFVNLSSPDKGIVVNNADWLRGLEFLPFLREFGTHFSVNRMLTAESVKQRLEKGLTFLEFNYMIMQSYDFYHLHKTYQCTVQLGGDDQWSNMLGGMELVRRKSREQAFCVTVPLLVTSSGKKMGKTEKGAVWIDPNLTSPYDLFQYFRNVDDDMVEKCLFYFTDLPVSDIQSLMQPGQNINDAKVALAYESTKLLHGEEEAVKAKNAAAALFSKGGDVKPAGAPEVSINRKTFGTGMNVIDLMVEAKVFATKSEARRMVEQGGLTVNGHKIEGVTQVIPLEWLEQPDGMLVRKGKKAYYNLMLT